MRGAVITLARAALKTHAALTHTKTLSARGAQTGTPEVPTARPLSADYCSVAAYVYDGISDICLLDYAC